MGTTAAPSTVWLKGQGHVKELTAAASIMPGSIVKRNTSQQFALGASADEIPLAVALENDLVGKGIDVAIASGDRCRATYAQPGDEFLGILAANATAVVVGSPLMVGANGTVALRTATNPVIGYALEAKDNSASGSTARLKFEAK